jgi:hypothetical protein
MERERKYVYAATIDLVLWPLAVTFIPHETDQ